MVLNSLGYLLFLPVVFAGYYLLPGRMRNAFLLAASLAFYGCWELWFMVFLLWAIAVGYLSTVGWLRRSPLWVAVVLTLLPLAFFKYGNASHWLVPVGISFYTFQTLAYIVDVRKGRLAAERNIVRLALFVSFFPQILSGPINRGADLLPQIEQSATRSFDRSLAFGGCQRLLWGLFMKTCVADRAALFVNVVFADYAHFNGTTLLLATLCYALQLYADFAGYSLMAIGSAEILGFRFRDNFRRPYFSLGFGDFWRRWHISLSTWLRDYVYIPLGGSRTGMWRTRRNLLVTFLVSGVWHGAGPTFLVWGLCHGLLVVAERQLPMEAIRRHRLTRIIGIALTFLLASLLWLLFRLPTLSDVGNVLWRMATTLSPSLQIPDNRDMKATVVLMVVMGGLLLLKDLVDEYCPRQVSGLSRWAACIIVAMLVLLFGVLDAGQFIYISF